MPFKSWQAAEERLKNPKPLKRREISDLFEYMNLIGETAMRRLSLQNLRALQDFERSSRILSIVLVILTGVIAWYTVVLARKDKPVSPRVAAQISAKKMLGPWKAKFTVPGSASLPEDSPIVKCSFAKSANAGFGYISVTVANLSDESYSVRYNIYGYDQNGKRISQGNDEFAIGKHEAVLRNVFLKSEDAVLGKLGSVFWIQMVLED